MAQEGPPRAFSLFTTTKVIHCHQEIMLIVHLKQRRAEELLTVFTPERGAAKTVRSKRAEPIITPEWKQEEIIVSEVR